MLGSPTHPTFPPPPHPRSCTTGVCSCNPITCTCCTARRSCMPNSSVILPQPCTCLGSFCRPTHTMPGRCILWVSCCRVRGSLTRHVRVLPGGWRWWGLEMQVGNERGCVVVVVFLCTCDPHIHQPPITLSTHQCSLPHPLSPLKPLSLPHPLSTPFTNNQSPPFPPHSQSVTTFSIGQPSQNSKHSLATPMLPAPSTPPPPPPTHPAPSPRRLYDHGQCLKSDNISCKQQSSCFHSVRKWIQMTGVRGYTGG